MTTKTQKTSEQYINELVHRWWEIPYCPQDVRDIQLNEFLLELREISNNPPELNFSEVYNDTQFKACIGRFIGYVEEHLRTPAVAE